MKRKEVMSISDFMSRDFKEEFRIAKVKRNKNITKVTLVCGLTITIFLSGFDYAGATSGIDAGARKIYSKLLTVGKWVIIIKGGMESIQRLVEGDHSAARKSFLSYLLVYVILQGFPWAMDEVDKVFQDGGLT